jgi:hypothetical protein
MDVDAIIEAVGGRAVVMRRFGISRSATYNWRHDGVPSRLWPDFVDLAASNGNPGVTFDALKATRRSPLQVNV